MTDMRPSPQTTLGILLGASKWPHSNLQDSSAFAKSAQKVRDYFLHSEHFGFRPENWLDLFDRNQSSPYEVDKRISTFLQERISLMKRAGMPARDLLFYYIGHGVFAFGPDQAFHLAIRSTRDESLRASAIAMAALAETLKTNARQLRRFVILDCCFAAEAFKYMQSAPYQAAQKQTISVFEEKSRGRGFPRKGTTLLCSSGNKEASLLLPDESGTMFSEALIQVLVLGNTHQRDKTHLSLYDVKTILEGVLENSMKGNAPRPFVSSPDQSDGDVASIPFFPNSRARIKRNQEGVQAHSSTQMSQKTRQKWLKEGNSIRDPKRSAEALTAIEQSIRQYPSDAVAYYAKGYTLNDLKRYVEALVALERAIRLDPNIADFYKGKGNALNGLMRHEEALAAYEQAIRLNPNYAIAYNNKGNVLNDLKRYRDALAAYEQAIRLNPNYALAYYNKGIILNELKRYEEALVAEEQAIKLDPSNSASYQQKSNALNGLKRYEEALAAEERAIKLNRGFLVYLVRGEDRGRAAWHYILVDQDKLSLFKQKLEIGNIDVAEYGKILNSGWGENPPPEIVEAINSQYS